MANQRFRLWLFLVAAALLGLALPVQAARTVVIDTQALRVEGVGDSQVIVMPEFTAHSEEYTLSGVSGRFESASETFLATGAPDRPARLERSGESPFTVTATRSITIVFQDESLRAEGEVSSNLRTCRPRAICSWSIAGSPGGVDRRAPQRPSPRRNPRDRGRVFWPVSARATG